MVILFLLLASLLGPAASAQDRSQARSMTISDRGIVATSQTLASQAGAQVLARGGSAIDAAIAANATLGVVEPERGGIGGDLFVIYYESKTGKLTGINASGWAPRGLNIERLKSMGNRSMPQLGIHSVTVPGCVDGWAKLHAKFGELPPNGQGVGPLEMLNILAQFPLGSYPPRGVEELHTQIEAQKLTFAD